MTFSGSLEELSGGMGDLGIACHWEHKGSFQPWIFEDGVSNLTLNWWPETGELGLLGDREQRDAVERSLAERLSH